MPRVAKKYTRYADDVLSGKVLACDHVKAACRRYLSLFDKYRFDAKACDRVVRFISRLRHFTSSHNGKPFILEPWQEFIVYSVYGFKRSDGTRLVRNAYIDVGRKNGKTCLVSALTLYHLIGDGEANAQVILSATSARQAALCFTMAVNFIRPLDPDGILLRRYRDSIKFDLTRSQLEVVAADASKLDGKNASMFVCDELHEFPDGSVYNVLQSSVGMREQPLGVAITTAGFHLSGWAYEFRQTMLDLIHGEKEDDSTFAVVYSLDSEDEADDPEKWIKSNPNLGVTVKPEYLRQQHLQAKNNPSLWANFMTKLMNTWVSSRDSWIPDHYVRAAMKEIDLKEREGDVAYIGLDLSAVSDLTAMTLLLPDEENGTVTARTSYYIPQEQLRVGENRQKYREWARRGYLNVTPGNVVDYDRVVADIMELTGKYSVWVVGYDQWNSTSLAVTLTEQGVNMEPFSMSIGSLNRPVREVERLMLSGKITLAENPVDRWCFENVVPKFDVNGNCRPTKAANANKIDGVMSLVMAIGVWLTTTRYGDAAFVIPDS